jgi:2Fe-2S iron-sulfur cluster binding domain
MSAFASPVRPTLLVRERNPLLLAARPRAPPVAHAGARRPPRATLAADAAATQAYDLAPGEVVVRFKNTPDGVDVLTPANPGENLLTLADSAGVTIPRGCQSGLCGACTSDIVDCGADGGVQVVRACQTVVAVVEGGVEMVVDVYRIKEFLDRNVQDPMARFDNLDTDYVAGAAPKRKGMGNRKVDCPKCAATGDIECYGCEGKGHVALPNSTEMSYCPLCTGTKELRCACCQGTGMTTV